VGDVQTSDFGHEQPSKYARVLVSNMSELRYPNESREYRDARESLLKDEQELIDKVRSVAERRRNLPPGGQLKEDYVFQWANDGKVGQSVKFSRAICRQKHAAALLSCTVRDGTTPVLPVRRWSMGLIEPGIRSLKTPRLSQLPKPRPIESMRGPNNVDGRRLRWFPDRTLRIRPITNARETLMICNGQ
jgi:hypothetical protein